MPIKSIGDGGRGEGEESPAGPAAGEVSRDAKVGVSGPESGSSTSRAPCPHRRLGAPGEILLVAEGGSSGTSEGMPHFVFWVVQQNNGFRETGT